MAGLRGPGAGNDVAGLGRECQVSRGASHLGASSNLDGLTLCGTYPGSVQHGQGSHRFGRQYRLSTNTRNRRGEAGVVIRVGPLRRRHAMDSTVDRQGAPTFRLLITPAARVVHWTKAGEDGLRLHVSLRGDIAT